MPQQSESDVTDESPPSVLSKKRHNFEDDPEDCVHGDIIKYAISYMAIIKLLIINPFTVCDFPWPIVILLSVHINA